MKYRALKAVASALAAMALLAPAVWAQRQIAPETFLRLTGDASVGYIKSSAQGGLDSVNFGLSADLNGYYYHPGFLQFQFSPYYNQGREYSAADFIAGDKGFTSAVSLFTGSNIPLFINYSLARTRSGLYGVVGSENSVVGRGSSDNLSLNWSVQFPRWPSVQIGYQRGGGDYEIFGTNGSTGKSRFSGYLLATQYNLFGFMLTGSYNSQRLKQRVPSVFLTDRQTPLTYTDQKNLQFSVNRQITKTTFFDANASRMRWSTDVTSRAQSRRYDTVNAGLSARPWARLATSARVNYTSNLSALLIGSILPGSQPTDPLPFLPSSIESRARYLNYSGYATYTATREFSVMGSYRRGGGSYADGNKTRDRMLNGGANYSRALLGGRLTAGYSLALYGYENGSSETSSQGHSGRVAFTRPIYGWEHTGAFNYSTTDFDNLLPGSTRVLSAELTSSGQMKGWRLITTIRHEKVRTVFSSESDNRREALRVAFSKPRLSFAGSLQFGSGLSILTVAGVRQASLAQAVAASSEFDRLLIPSENFSATFSASVQLRKRTSLTGGWSRMQYRTVQQDLVKENQLDRLDVHVRHWFRQLDCRAGYQRYHQKFDTSSGLFNINTVYFQVSRHFDVF
jgi:hypothetical protein